MNLRTGIIYLSIYLSIQVIYTCLQDFPGGSDGKASVYNAGDLGSIPGSGRFPGEGNGNPLQYSCLGNPRGRGTGGLQSMGLQRVGHDLVSKQHQLPFGSLDPARYPGPLYSEMAVLSDLSPYFVL